MTAQRTVLEVDLKPLAGAPSSRPGSPISARLSSTPPTAARRCWSSQPSRWPTGLRPRPGIRPAMTRPKHCPCCLMSASPIPGACSCRRAALRLTGSPRPMSCRARSAARKARSGCSPGSGWRGRPLDYRAVARACFALDPVSLVHGVFFARKEWPWQPKIARAVTSFVEAYDVIPAVSGGVKRDSVVNEGKDGATTEGYGMVPYHRVEYTAGTITAYFTVDHEQFRSYGLSEPATALLEALADFEIATLLDGGLRLRTACDLAVNEVRGERPDVQDAARRIAKLAVDCGTELGPVTKVTWSGRGRAS